MKQKSLHQFRLWIKPNEADFIYVFTNTLTVISFQTTIPLLRKVTKYGTEFRKNCDLAHTFPQERLGLSLSRLLSTETMDLVQRSLDASAMQHKVISDNLANVDTPGFKRSEVAFAEKIRQAFEARSRAGSKLEAAKTQSGHMDFVTAPDVDEIQPAIVLQNETALRRDGNNVDIDHEMALLAQNTILYSTLSQVTQMQFASLRSAIFEGRR